MWKKVMENIKLILTSLALMSALVIGSYNVVVEKFVTRAENNAHIIRVEYDVGYNKAFRLETKIGRLLQYQAQRELSDTEKKSLKRLISQLKMVDDTIEEIEINMGINRH